MIGYLKGQILEHTEGRILILVGGVGYCLTVPQSMGYTQLEVGKNAEFYIHTHVREDALDLFGFTTPTEKELFLLLLTANKVGPKVSLSILSSLETHQIIEAILNNHIDLFTSVSGVGRKTAERIGLELRDRLRKKLDTGFFVENRSISSSAVLDAKQALIGLGYREPDVTSLLNRMTRDGQRNDRAEDLIKSALQHLGN